MNDLNKAKMIYKQIYKSIMELQKQHHIFCALPSYIELDGIIYQSYQCLNEEWLDFSKLSADQLVRVMNDKTTFYRENNND